MNCLPKYQLSVLDPLIHPWHLGIFGFLSLKNCSRNMLQQEATQSTFRGKVLRYSPVATTFAIYYYTLETFTMTCHYDHIFTGKSCYSNVKSILLTGRCNLQAGLNHSSPIGRHNRTLIKVTDNNWKIPVSPTYNCGFRMTIVNTYHNFHVRIYKAQLIGAANFIEQHTLSCCNRYHS